MLPRLVHSLDCGADLVAAGDVLPSGGIGACDPHLLTGHRRDVVVGCSLRREGSGYKVFTADYYRMSKQKL